ncbi:hypothetical protein [Arthrobacter globiformis]|uniref:hypothetical protein n=1 Tax=Arthrobacter globiformis TaxID=1665 RepID=UPI00278A7232|nr:hypothetical protein [Arthrobacter globiformis]MDQ0864805.1 hypothetical protein [Arthrobacter globiformis]
MISRESEIHCALFRHGHPVALKSGDIKEYLPIWSTERIAKQQCKPGDWLVDDDGDTNTVDADVFAATKEGRTSYNRGDVVVFNNENGTDGYAMTAERFNSRYEPDQ